MLITTAAVHSSRCRRQQLIFSPGVLHIHYQRDTLASRPQTSKLPDPLFLFFFIGSWRGKVNNHKSGLASAASHKLSAINPNLTKSRRKLHRKLRRRLGHILPIFPINARPPEKIKQSTATGPYILATLPIYNYHPRLPNYFVKVIYSSAALKSNHYPRRTLFKQPK